MFDRHLCPFYEGHAGNYHQGCWEFYNLCGCSQELGLNPNCYTGCFFIRNDEKKMLEICIEALYKKREIKCQDGSSIGRDLTVLEKRNIIMDMETFMNIFNKRYQPSLLYK